MFTTPVRLWWIGNLLKELYIIAIKISCGR
jgi:hypothetical protein